jgi:anti-sigma regulatory factor (Ser/Thr protein kinase)
MNVRGSSAPQDDAEADGANGVVELRFAALPEHVRTARLVAVALARRAHVEEGLLDEVRLAVGEACSRAVGLHRRNAPSEPVAVYFAERDKRFMVDVADVVGQEGAEDGAQETAAPPDADMGLAVLTGLVDDLDIEHDDKGGTVRMGWPTANSSASAIQQLLP